MRKNSAMKNVARSAERTAHFFDRASGFWRDVYASDGLEGVIYRRRLGTALDWVDKLGLSPGAAVLDVGCGAGLLAAELAARGLRVTGTDTSIAMLETARDHAADRGLEGHVELVLEDAQSLSFSADRFDLVVALGLLPWVLDERATVREMARVMRPGATLILTADNRARLNAVIEPRQNPLLTPVKLARRAVKRAAGAVENDSVSWRLHLPSQVDGFVREAGLEPRRRATVGYGPFTFMGRPLFTDEASLRLHLRLEERARGNRLVARVGWHYMLMARKPAR
jgi:ubiquinone/menaquinone biosynthesis C-methylase UbiE